MDKSLKQKLVFYLSENPKNLEEIYLEFQDQKKTTIRGRLNESINICFKRISKGWYIAITKIHKIEFLLPNKKYKLIYADSAWSYNNKNTGGSFKSGAVQKYNTMSLETIISMPISRISEKDSILLLWATNPLLMEAMIVISAWGFQYKTVAFTWIKMNQAKPFLGLGHYTRSNSEQCLLGVKGKGLTVLNHSISQVILSNRRAHSRKPDEAYRKIESLFGNVPKIELFTRNRRQGWDAWGNQVPKETQNLLEVIS